MSVVNSVMIPQVLAPAALTLHKFTYVSRTAVLVKLALFWAGVIAAIGFDQDTWAPR